MAGVDLQATGASAYGQGVEPIEPLCIGLGLGIGDARQAHQCLVHFIDASGCRPGFFAHGGDGVGIQLAKVIGRLRVAPAPVEHGLCAAFLQRCIVKKGVGACAENFRCQR